MPALTLQELKPHPAQMRTTYDLEALATLTLQVATRGLDHWQPVVVAPNGRSRPDDPATYHIISGHRRHMAQLLALTLAAQEAEPATEDMTDVTLEQVRTLLHTLVETHGSLDAAVAHLLARHGRAEIPVVFFEGDAKAEILALQAGALVHELC